MYRFTRLSFRVVPAGEMFRRKTDKIFKDIPYVSGTVDYILIVGYDAEGRDHNRILR